jgi:hypothetical protein
LSSVFFKKSRIICFFSFRTKTPAAGKIGSARGGVKEEKMYYAAFKAKRIIRAKTGTATAAPIAITRTIKL